MLDGGDIAFEDVISSLEDDKKRAEEERDEAVRITAEMRRQKEELEKQAKKFEARKEKELEKAREQAREIIREAKEVSDDVKAELRYLSKAESLGEKNQRFREEQTADKRAGTQEPQYNKT